MSTQETPTQQPSPGDERGRGGLGVLEAAGLGPYPAPPGGGWRATGHGGGRR